MLFFNVFLSGRLLRGKALRMSIANCTLANLSSPCNMTTMTPNASLTTSSTGNAATTSLTDKQKIRITIYVLSIVLSWVGNSLVIVVSYLNRQSLSPCRILMAHLAITNLLFSFRLPFQIRLEVNGYVWEWGAFYCKIMHGFSSASLLASIETVTVIAIERYRGISRPYARKWTKTHIIISIALVWFIALITYTPYMYYLDLRGLYCSDKYPSLTAQQAYSIVIFVFRYVIPLMILSYCYFNIGLVVHRRPTRVSTHQSQENENSRKRENNRIIRILVVIVVAFALLTAPTSIWWLWYDFGGSGTAVALDLIEVFAAFLYLHSAINPIIYGIMDQQFKKGVQELFAMACGSIRTGGTSLTGPASHRGAPSVRVVTFAPKAQ